MKFVVITLDKISVNVCYEDEKIIENMKSAFSGYMTFNEGFDKNAFSVVLTPKDTVEGFYKGYKAFWGKEPGDKKLNAVYIGKSSLVCKYEPENDYLEFTKYVVLNTMMKIFENAGYYFLHASCVEKDGKAYAFSGKKGAGKTATMINMLANKYNMLTNDKLAVRLDENGNPVCVGFPTTIGIRMTKKWCSQERNKPIVATIKQKHPEILTAADSSDLSSEEKKFFFEPRVITKSFDTGITHTARLVKIINTNFDPNASKFETVKDDLRELILDQNEEAVSIEKPYINEIEFKPFELETDKIVDAMADLDNYKVYQGVGMDEDFIDVLDN